ncbi:MAG TPA: hypothetical protein VIM84_12745, partial [Gemmatimonadales bacterium]
MSQPFKTCIQCGNAADLSAPACVRCGNGFTTHFQTWDGDLPPAPKKKPLAVWQGCLAGCTA